MDYDNIEVSIRGFSKPSIDDDIETLDTLVFNNYVVKLTAHFNQ